jgi:hypothetical protein
MVGFVPAWAAAPARPAAHSEAIATRSLIERAIGGQASSLEQPADDPGHRRGAVRLSGNGRLPPTTTLDADATPRVGGFIDSFHRARPDRSVRLSALADILEQFEDGPAEVRIVVLCHCVAGNVTIDEDDLNGALRRAQLLLATGGDPRRPLELDGRAVGSLAGDLDDEEGRRQLLDQLAGLAGELEELPEASATLAELGADPDLAWRGFAAALLADALAEPD